MMKWESMGRSRMEAEGRSAFHHGWYYQIDPLEKAHFGPALQIPDGLCVDG